MLALFFASVTALLAAADTPDPSSTPVPVADRARELIKEIQNGKVDRTLLSPAFNDAFTNDVIATDANLLGGRGKPARFELLERSDAGDDLRYVFVAGWNDGAVNYTFGIDKASGLIDACYFRLIGAGPAS